MRESPTEKSAGSRSDEGPGHPPCGVAVTGDCDPRQVLPRVSGDSNRPEKTARTIFPWRVDRAPHLSLHPADRCGLHHLAFSVDGREAVDAAATELERRGITLLAYPAPTWTNPVADTGCGLSTRRIAALSY